MAVPDFQTIMLPLLQLTSDGVEHSLAASRHRGHVIGVRSIFVVKADPKIYGRKLTCIDLTPVPDDFGTGFSSLARLRAMPLAELKIDRLFVANMNRSRTDLQIVRTVIDLAHNFELEVVAEGVEDEATVRHLHALGCDAIQGYFYARPMGIDNLRDWWDKRPDLGALLDDPGARKDSALRAGPARAPDGNFNADPRATALGPVRTFEQQGGPPDSGS